MQKLDFSNQHFMWGLYTQYAYKHAGKSVEKSLEDSKQLMTPGLFCQYFAIRLAQAKLQGKPETMETIIAIIDELADPNCTFCSDPCGPVGCMRIYYDADGDTLPMHGWVNY